MSIQEGVIAGLAVLTMALAYMVVSRRRDRRNEAGRFAGLAELNARLVVALEEKTEAEAALARSEAQFRADFEWAAVGKVHYDPLTGVIIRVNRAHAAMLGYEPEEMVGRLGMEFTHPDDRDPAPYRAMTSGAVEGYAREKRYLRRDGSAVWGRVSAGLVRDPGGGEPQLAVAVIEDIDDRYKARLALEEAKLDLERVVAERTSALVQRDLLLREVYHRVKNNLQVVDSLIVLQAKRLGDLEARGALESLRARLFTLGLVHHQLMGSSDLRTFDVAPFLEELSQRLRDYAGAGLGLSVRAAPLHVGLDFGIPLGLLVTELITDAYAHARADGGATVEVELAEGGPGELVLQVSDDGRPDRGGADGLPSLAATIVEALVAQLKGVLTVSQGGRVRSVVRMPTPALS